jgi:hypothetical protein
MKWIGQHIYDLVARFRNDVYLEDLSTTTETNVLVVDSTGKVSKTTVITGDVTGVTAGSNITVTDPTGPVPTVALSTNVDVAGTLDVTSLGTFDASVTVAGNVGIGTASPEQLLHISGASGLDGATPVSSYLYSTNGGTWTDNAIFAQQLFGNADASGDGSGGIKAKIAAYVNDTTATTTGLSFYTSQSGTTIAERLRITSSGKVGIGTTSPSRQLEVSNTGDAIIRIAGDSDNDVGETGDAVLEMTTDAGNHGWSIRSANILGGTGYFKVNTFISSVESTKLLIDRDGNVGIGTASPVGKLEVQTVDANRYIRFKAPNGEERFQFYTGGTGNYSSQFMYDADGTTRNVQIAAGGTSYFNGGNVGIGNTNPQNKLDIVGSLGRGAPVTKTTDFTVAATENWLIMNGTATITITLPTASSFTGRELMIKNIAAYTVISASSNVKPIDTDNAATAILPATAGSWCTLVSDGTNWVTMMN